MKKIHSDRYVDLILFNSKPHKTAESVKRSIVKLSTAISMYTSLPPELYSISIQ